MTQGSRRSNRVRPPINSTPLSRESKLSKPPQRLRVRNRYRRPRGRLHRLRLRPRQRLRSWLRPRQRFRPRLRLIHRRRYRSVGRQDICYRALPVQDALLNKFSDTYLCSAVQLGELFRITELDVKARGHLLKRTDFTDMPNLKLLEVETDLEGLAPDVFHSLSGLSGLRLTFDMYYSNGETLPSDLLNGLPSGLEWLELRLIQPPSGDNEKQAIDLPSDLFSSVPHIKRLAISLSSSGRGWHLEFGPRTMAGLSNLESLELRGPLAAIPRELLADLQSLEMLTLSNTAVFGGPHILYFPTVEMLVKFGKYCNDTDFCVTGGIIEQ